MTWEAIAGLVYNVGLRGEQAVTAVALTEPESTRDPSKINDNPGTGDLSYGLWQINMIGDLGPARRKRYNILTNDALLDPAVNCNAMYLESGGGGNFRGPWPNTLPLIGPFLDEARAAVNAVEARGGPPTVHGTGGSSSSSSGSASLGRSPDVTYAIPKGLRGGELDYPPSSIWGPGFFIRGQSALRTVVADTLSGGSVDMGVDDIAELTVELAVVGGLLGGPLDPSKVLDLDADVDWFDLLLRCVGQEWGPGPSGIAVYTARCRAAGPSEMRKRDGLTEATWSNMSPTEVMSARAGNHHMNFVGEGSNRRDLITRKGPSDPAAVAAGADTDAESDWDLGQRLAREEGYWCFESSGTLYFARPSWLESRMPRFAVAVTAGGLRGIDDYERTRNDGVLDVPDARRTRDEDLKPGLPTKTLTVKIPRARGERIRPGFVADLTGLTRFDGPFLVSRVSFPLDGGIEPATVDLVQPKDPVPEPPADQVDADGNATGGAAGDAAGSADGGNSANPVNTAGHSALDMVTIALRQVGKSYVYGAEAAPDDPDPTAFDCSELIQWACAQVGVDFADGSENQMAAVRAAGLPDPPHGLAVADCANIRGAFLWHPGHCAISLGDGKHTVEAMGRQYGVVQGNIGSRFLGGGLIPGLDYGPKPQVVDPRRPGPQ